jgi:hypothetical protein
MNLLGKFADVDAITSEELKNHMDFGRAYGQPEKPLTVEWDARVCRTLKAAFDKLSELPKL